MLMQKVCSLLLFALLFAASSAAPVVAGDEKLKAEDVVEKSLAALGAPEKRAAIKTRAAEGTSLFRVLVGGSGEAPGRAFVLSEGRRTRIAFPTDAYDFWGEQFGSDGNKAEVAFVQPSRRSQFGGFLYRYDQLVREGLVSGVLSTAWPLLDLAERQPKLRYDGTKKVDGKELHRLTYVMKKGQGEVEIVLFFEPGTFRHVRTSYAVLRSSPLGPDITQSSQQQETRFSLDENFSDFQEVDGLTLPMQWGIKQTIQTGQRVVITQYEIKLVKIRHNIKFTPTDLVVAQPNK